MVSVWAVCEALQFSTCSDFSPNVAGGSLDLKMTEWSSLIGFAILHRDLWHAASLAQGKCDGQTRRGAGYFDRSHAYAFLNWRKANALTKSSYIDSDPPPLARQNRVARKACFGFYALREHIFNYHTHHQNCGVPTIELQLDITWGLLWHQIEAAVAVIVASITFFRSFFVADRSNPVRHMPCSPKLPTAYKKLRMQSAPPQVDLPTISSVYRKKMQWWFAACVCGFFAKWMWLLTLTHHHHSTLFTMMRFFSLWVWISIFGFNFFFLKKKKKKQQKKTK